VSTSGRYALAFLPSAIRQLRKLPRDVLRRIKEVTEALRDDPRPTGVIKVKNADEWRRRVGDYRITFTVDDSSRTVTVAWVGHRRDAYRDLS
jgi:mRNA interferase RelE/StbE